MVTTSAEWKNDFFAVRHHHVLIVIKKERVSTEPKRKNVASDAFTGADIYLHWVPAESEARRTVLGLTMIKNAKVQDIFMRKLSTLPQLFCDSWQLQLLKGTLLIKDITGVYRILNFSSHENELLVHKMWKSLNNVAFLRLITRTIWDDFSDGRIRATLRAEALRSSSSRLT